MKNKTRNTIMASVIGLAGLIAADANALPKNCRKSYQNSLVCTIKEPTRIITYHAGKRGSYPLRILTVDEENKHTIYASLGCKNKVTSKVTRDQNGEEILARTEKTEEIFAKEIDPEYEKLVKETGVQ